MTLDGEGLAGLGAAATRLVLAEDHTEAQMRILLDPPVTTHRAGTPCGVCANATDFEAALGADHAVALATRPEHGVDGEDSAPQPQQLQHVRRAGGLVGVGLCRQLSDPLISVVLCTRNRANLLLGALTSIAGQDLPQSEYEVVLVDNGSTDQTAKVALDFQSRAPLQYVRENRVGLSIARNTGWQAANGAIVAYIDDDATAKGGWLKTIRETFATNQAGMVGLVGGPVEPIWQAPRPTWLSDEIARSLTIVDWGSSEKIIPDIRKEWLAGANMAMPKCVLEKVGGFHPSLDRIGTNLLSNGDILLQREIARRGYRCLYTPAMAISHLVPSSRLSKDWFLRRFYWQGFSDAVMHIIEQSPSPYSRIGCAIRRAGRLVLTPRRIRALFSSGGNRSDFALKCFALLDIGFVLGLLVHRRRNPASVSSLRPPNSCHNRS